MQPFPAQNAPALTRLGLRDFRNYQSQALDLEGRIVVLFGPNGAGKTNFLEAVSLFSPGRGLRRCALEDMDRDQAGPWRIQASFVHVDGPLELITRRDAETGRRSILLFDKPLRGPAALAQLLSITWLTPLMDRLFIDAAASRRRYLDRMVLTVQPDHATRVGQYERALRERVAVLRGGRHDKAWLDALERRIAEAGVAIAAARSDFVDAINPILAETGLELPRLQLRIAGEIESELEKSPAIDVETIFADKLKQSRERDRQTGGAARGTHRSDLVVGDLETGEAVARTSTGRQKSALLALVLGEARLRRNRFGDLPIILMDEVAAHLDADRRARLCRTLVELGAQTFLTGTDRHLFDDLESEAQFLHVDKARISKEGESS